MQFGVLITNGGAHSPDTWAVATAEMIFPLDPKLDGPRLVLAKKVQLAVTEALLPHHAGVQTDERGKLTSIADHAGTALNANSEADAALASVIAAIVGTPWAEKTDDPAWKTVTHSIIAQHFCDAKRIERQWHAAK